MHKPFALFVGLFFYMTAVASAADSRDAFKQNIQTAYNSQCADLVARRYDKWRNSMSKDFVLVTAEGKRQGRNMLVREIQDSAITWTMCYAIVRDFWRSANFVKVVVTNGGRGSVVDSRGVTHIETQGDSIDVWQLIGNRLIENLINRFGGHHNR